MLGLRVGETAKVTGVRKQASKYSEEIPRNSTGQPG